MIPSIKLLPSWRAIVATLCSAAATFFTTATRADDFVASESRVTLSPDVSDPEFNPHKNQVVSVDSDGNVWLAQVDPDTGLFIPRHGKGILIDSGATSTDDLDLIGNGPEWVSVGDVQQIVYTKFKPGWPHDMRGARLAVAFPTGEGTWTNQFLRGPRRRNGPYASTDFGDPNPRISYVDRHGNHFWRNLLDPTSEVAVPWMPQSYRSLRFVPGSRTALFTAPVRGVRQVFLYWLDLNVPQQLTFDDGDKDLHSVPWMWRAPEYGHAYVFATIVDDEELRIYAKVDPESVGWTSVYSTTTPLGGVLNSPEPFVYRGKSYVAFASTLSTTGYPAAIFIAGLSSPTQMARRITPLEPQRMRHDPEVFIANDGPYIYYNRFDPDEADEDERVNCEDCAEGIYRAYTGL